MRSAANFMGLPLMMFVVAVGNTSLRICTPEFSSASHLNSASNSKFSNACVVQRKLLPVPETDAPVSTPSSTVYLALPLCSSQPSRFLPLNKSTQPFCASRGLVEKTPRAVANKKKPDAFICFGIRRIIAKSGYETNHSLILEKSVFHLRNICG